MFHSFYSFLSFLFTVAVTLPIFRGSILARNGSLTVELIVISVLMNFVFFLSLSVTGYGSTARETYLRNGYSCSSLDIKRVFQEN